MNTFTSAGVRYARTMGVLLLVLSFAFAPLTQVFAQNPNEFPNNPNIGICHANGNGTYTSNTVDANSIVKGTGHGGHENDIIPEFDFDLGEGPDHFDGQNWDEEIYNGGDCNGGDQIAETVTVVFQKVVEGNDAFDADDFSFNVTDDGEFDETVDSGNSLELEAGSYAVTESYTQDGFNPEDWEVEWSGACSAGQDQDGSLYIDVDDVNPEIAIDGDLTCTVTNTYIGEGDGGNYPTECKMGSNLLSNADFETPDVTNEAGWDIFTLGIDWIVSWINPNEATPSLELHGGVNGWLPFTGSQYAELDGDTEGPSGSTSGESASTRIAQTVTTVPGAEYELSYYFSARPGSDTSDNELDVLVAGDSVDTKSADGSANSNTDWNIGSYTFTATTTSTEIAFADLGDSDSIGTFLDNTALCMVKEAPVEQCSITIVSDESNLVEGGEGGDTPAELVTFIHDLWDAVIPGASWIWGDDPFSETDPTATTTQTFVKTFNWNGPVTSAVLDLAADNSYVVYLNGVEVAADPSESNHFASDNYDLSGDIAQGVNTLEVEVTNWQQNGGTQESNPAGLLYKLVVTGTDEDCGEPGEGGNNGRYTLNVETTGDGEGTVIASGEEPEIQCDSENEESDCTEVYPSGTEVTLTATPKEGSNFDGTWHGACAAFGNNPVCNLTITVNTDVEAHFGLNGGDSSSTSGGGGGGGQRISLRQGGNNNDEGEVLGAQTSVLPVGAPNAGEGGTSSTGVVALFALIALVGSTLFTTRTQN